MTQAIDLQANYAQAGYHRRLGYGKRLAVLLVDFVQAYFERSSPLYAEVERPLASAMRVLAAARAAKLPVVFTNVVYHPSGLDGGIFFRKVPALKHLCIGGPLGRWAPGLNPLPTDLVISKQYPSAFFGTSLASTLHAAGIDGIVITGLTTSGCVRATCVDAVSNGFIPTVVREACGDRHSGPHEANLFDMDAKYADVVSEQDLMQHLAVTANPRGFSS